MGTLVRLQDWVPFVISTGNPLSALLVGFGAKSGWLVLIATQLIFVTYGWATHQVGFTLQLMMIVVGVHNWWLWKQRDDEVG